MSNDRINYAQFNALTITGRIANLKVLKGQYGESLVVTLITTLETDKQEMNIVFSTKGGLLTMFQNGNLDTGRTMTVTGHIRSVEEVYIDADGQAAQLKRPRMNLKQVQVLDGGLGPAPKKENAPSTVKQLVKLNDRQPKVDTAPPITPESVYSDYE